MRCSATTGGTGTRTRSASSSACCLEKGVVSEQMLREEMARNHVRHDALELVERTPPLAA